MLRTEYLIATMTAVIFIRPIVRTGAIIARKLPSIQTAALCIVPAKGDL
jgi:hypothetical protein